MISEQQITDALKAVNYPGYSRDIVSFGLRANRRGGLVYLHGNICTPAIPRSTASASALYFLRALIVHRGQLNRDADRAVGRRDVLHDPGRSSSAEQTAEHQTHRRRRERQGRRGHIDLFSQSGLCAASPRRTRRSS
jgi:hypothetical protein